MLLPLLQNEVPVEEWQPIDSLPIRKLVVTAAIASFFFVPEITPTDWIPVQSELSAKIQRVTGETVYPFTEPSLDWQPLEPYTRPTVRLMVSGETRVDVVVVIPETVTLDKWFQPIGQPYFSKWRTQGDDPIVLEDFVPPPPPAVFERPVYSQRHIWVDTDQLLREDDEILELLKIWVECQ